MESYFPKKLRLVYVLDNKANGEFLGSHGLSIYLEATYDSSSQAIVLDAGDSEEKLLHNLKILEEKGKIDKEKIRAVVLSHGHWDHGDGLVGLFKFIGRKIPLIAHPKAFVKRISTVPFIRRVGIKFTEDELEKAGAYIVKVSHPLELLPGIFFSGEIPRVYEPSIDGVYFIQQNNNGSLIEDEIVDDSAIFGIGADTLFAITGCGHSGILNIIKYLKEFFNSEKKGVSRILVTGGFHLSKKKRDKLVSIADNLLQITSSFKEVYFAPCHCTGDEFVRILKHRVEESNMNTVILTPQSGSELILDNEVRFVA